jgi:hypothetical protein
MIRVALLAVLCALFLEPTWAHHSFAAEFDVNKPINLHGKVTRLEFINPHCWIHIDVTNPDGSVVNWAIEGGSPNALLRLGFNKNSLPVGTAIVVEGYQAKDGSNRGVGKQLTFADGRRLFLGSSAPGANGPGTEEKK